MFGGDDTEFIAPVAPGNWIRFSSNRAELSRSVFQAAARGCGHHGCESQAIVQSDELSSRLRGWEHLTLTSSRMWTLDT